MIASRVSRIASLSVLGLWLAACATPAPMPSGSALQPLPPVGARIPEEADLLARDLAAAALVEPRSSSQALLGRLEELEKARAEEGLLPTGLVPVAADLVNTTLDDPIAYRVATAALLERDDLPSGLEKRLQDDVRDDPLRLADARLREAFVKDAAEVFNAIVAPLSKAAYTPIAAGIGLARSLVNLALSERAEPELEFRERQALAHWKRFLDENPESPLAAEIAGRTEQTQLRWNRTRRDEDLRLARHAMRLKRWDVAYLLAVRAERYWPEDGDAIEIRERAAVELSAFHADRARTLEVSTEKVAAEDTPLARDLAVALLLPDSDLEAAARSLLGSAPDGPLVDEARWALALAYHESGAGGHEVQSWKILDEVARAPADESNMSRHANALLRNPRQNPYAAFRTAQSSDIGSKLGWVFLGPYSKGPRSRDLPRPLEWLIDLPSMAQAITTFPNRLLQYPWMKKKPFGRGAAVHARNYLARHPDGAHADEVADWLGQWEGGQGNWLAAWDVAKGATQEDDRGGLLGLRLRASFQALASAQRQTRGDVRLSMLRHVAREFHGTDAGREAAGLARDELRKATAQRIRISRGFLTENPEVAGPDGLALRPELLDGKTQNGELHPEGVVLAGGRILEFNYVGASGSLRKPPVVRRQRVSEERLGRLVALLHETAVSNFAEDSGDVLGPDAGRDLFFERARLGVADHPDRRASARSTYTFLGLRERYGVVRGREPILPFDIVLQGSLPDLSVAVFPRMRAPRPTPDAILYK